MVRTPLHKEKSSAKYGSAMMALLFYKSQIDGLTMPWHNCEGKR